MKHVLFLFLFRYLSLTNCVVRVVNRLCRCDRVPYHETGAGGSFVTSMSFPFTLSVFDRSGSDVDVCPSRYGTSLPPTIARCCLPQCSREEDWVKDVAVCLHIHISRYNIVCVASSRLSQNLVEIAGFHQPLTIFQHCPGHRGSQSMNLCRVEMSQESFLSLCLFHYLSRRMESSHQHRCLSSYINTVKPVYASRKGFGIRLRLLNSELICRPIRSLSTDKKEKKYWNISQDLIPAPSLGSTRIVRQGEVKAWWRDWRLGLSSLI